MKCLLKNKNQVSLKKKLLLMVYVLLATLIISLCLSAFALWIIRSGSETIRMDNLQITDDGMFEYKTEWIYRSNPIWSSIEIWLLVKDLSSDEEHRIRLNEVLDKTDLQLPIIPYGAAGGATLWIDLQLAEDEPLVYIATLWPRFRDIERRFLLDMNSQTVKELDF